jgi:hypothetical protein
MVSILEVLTIIAYYWAVFKVDKYVEGIYFGNNGVVPIG